jgi:hypothetical protein
MSNPACAKSFCMRHLHRTARPAIFQTLSTSTHDVKYRIVILLLMSHGSYDQSHLCQRRVYEASALHCQASHAPQHPAAAAASGPLLVLPMPQLPTAAAAAAAAAQVSAAVAAINAPQHKILA